MSTSPTVYGDESQNSERRSGPRDSLKWVVLVYFGPDNWGKLVDLSESGMRFEYAQPPSDSERISFTFEAMGRLPASFGGEIITDSFQAAGDLRWTRDFERTAGVQFATLPEESREKIRKWLSFEASAATGPANTESQQTAPVPPQEPHEPAQAPSEALPPIYEHKYDLQLDAKSADFDWEQLGKPTEALEERITAQSGLDTSGADIAEGESEQAKTSDANPRLGQALSMGITISIAAVVVIGGARMILPRLAHGVPAIERVPNPPTGEGKPEAAEYGSVAASQRPFLVEVLDANNRRWLLWFDDSDSKNAPTQAAYRSSSPFSTPSPRGASRPKQPAASPKPSTPHKFTLIAPKASRPQASNSAKNLPSPVAPQFRDDPQPLLQAAVADVPGIRAISSPISPSAPVGGRVQVARLLKSVPPVYPPMARTNHVSGDVEMDALIDANGNVTELKVVSGPPILQQAAMDAVRQWKYDPARLNGQPVAMHLGLTVRFHFE
jgi:TonB family protein